MANEILSFSAANIRKVVQTMADGGVVVLPADTAYGIFGNALNKDAVEKVYALKSRERRKPFGLFSPPGLIDHYAIVNDIAKTLMLKFWPGPLSFILKKKATIPDWFTNNLDSVLIVNFTNPVMSSIISQVPFPLFSTTCNISGEPEMKSSEEIGVFSGKVDRIIADDASVKYKEVTTIVNCTISPPKVIRSGAIPYEILRNFMNEIEKDESLIIK
jgi:L-threonylcarbamoyladenylate synthase